MTCGVGSIATPGRKSAGGRRGGAADLNASKGFGLGAPNKASHVNQATLGPGVSEFGGGN
jgi:hypothetical protein